MLLCISEGFWSVYRTLPVGFGHFFVLVPRGSIVASLEGLAPAVGEL